MASLLTKIKNYKTQKWFIAGIWYTLLEVFGQIGPLLFTLFHMDMFLKGHKITTVEVASVQVVYIIWNVLNDLIAGYISDWYKHKCGSRLLLIIPLSICWNLVALFPFYYFNIPVMIHYFLCISLNDGFFSFVAILEAGVVVDDITETQKQRLNLSLITQPTRAIMIAIVTFCAYYYWDITNLTAFHYILYSSIIISIIATIIPTFILKKILKNPKYVNDNEDVNNSDHDSVHSDSDNDDNQKINDTNSNLDLEMMNMSIEYKKMDQNANKQTKIKSNIDVTSDNDTDTTNEKEKQYSSMKLFCKLVIKQKNLWFFVVPNVVNETQNVWRNTFQVIFVTILLNNWSLNARTTFISFLNFSPIVIGLVSLILAQIFGIYKICMMTLLVKLITSIIGLLFWLFVDKNEWEFLTSIYCAIYLVIVVWMFQMWGVFFMVNMGNLINEQKASRIDLGLPLLSSMTSRYWALHALCAKPFNSVGPILGTFVLEQAGYTSSNDDGDDGDFNDHSKVSQLRIQYACFALVVFFTLGGTLIQLAFWKFYTLYGDKLKNVHKSLSNIKTTNCGNSGYGSNEETLMK